MTQPRLVGRLWSGFCLCLLSKWTFGQMNPCTSGFSDNWIAFHSPHSNLPYKVAIQTHDACTSNSPKVISQHATTMDNSPQVYCQLDILPSKLATAAYSRPYGRYFSKRFIVRVLGLISRTMKYRNPNSTSHWLHLTWFTLLFFMALHVLLDFCCVFREENHLWCMLHVHVKTVILIWEKCLKLRTLTSRKNLLVTFFVQTFSCLCSIDCMFIFVCCSSLLYW